MSQALPSPAFWADTATAARPVTASAAPAPGAPLRERPRTPLALVPSRAANRRVPVAVSGFAALVIALATVLVLNISVSSGQYELVTLRNQQTALTHQNQALTQQVEDLGAPQNLAAAAEKLGMVASADFGVIDVDSMKAGRAPKPATEAGGPQVSVAAPDVTTSQDLAAREAARQEVARAEASGSVRAERTKRTAPQAGNAARQTPAPDLNGGTIPAPQQGGPTG